MLLLIDNFDSFTFNIVQAFGMLGVEVKVNRNTISLKEIQQLNPEYLIVGPGPGNPAGAGVSKAAISWAEQEGIPLLGVCLGHQALAEVFGGSVKRAPVAMHGKTSEIYHRAQKMFKGLPQGFKAARYHSLIVENCPEHFEVSAHTSHGEIMAISHFKMPLYGVQFHPESIATENGLTLLSNFLNCKNLRAF